MPNVRNAIKEDLKNLEKKLMKRNTHSPLKIETVLKAHYLPEFRLNRDYDALGDVVSQLLKDHILVRFAEHDSDADQLTLTEKGKAFVEMILNTPYPIQSWTDPRN
jgi:hypothetical protein